jgi:hypothetical protein
MKRCWMILVLAAGCGGGGSSDDGGSGGGGSAYAGDPRFFVDTYDATKVHAGTTLFATNYNNDPRVIEVDFDGNVVWEYELPDSMIGPGQIAIDAAYLEDTDTVLITATDVGVFEVEHDGDPLIVWQYLTNQVSHDSDRLPNGNTLYVFGHDDAETDTQVYEIDSSGTLVWSWRAKDNAEFDGFSGTFNAGWTHANAVQRLPNGNTLISLRNFQMTVEVETTVAGTIVNSYDWSTVYGDCFPHDPEYREVGGTPRVLVALQNDSPYQMVEIEWPSGAVVATYSYGPMIQLTPTRDADRLPNGNRLLQSVIDIGGVRDSCILEVTPAGTIVWQFRLVNFDETMNPGFIYKAQRK